MLCGRASGFLRRIRNTSAETLAPRLASDALSKRPNFFFMPPQGIQSFAPSVPNFSLFSAIHTEGAIAVIITLVFIWWAVFTLVVCYHWFRFGRESWLAVPSVALHVAISGWIFVFATGGFH
ncbi:MAG: hypothetical protein WBK28_03080 [Minisyncoccia bacterium]